MLCVVVVTGYIVVVVNEISLKLDELKITKNINDKSISVIEEGTIVSKKSLNNFLIFTERKRNIEKYIKELIDSENIKVNKNSYEILKTFEAEKFLGNDCSRYRCLQYRVNFEEIPSSLWKGLMGIEDYRFLDHDGVDIVSIARAFIADIKAMKLVQGGSTLTMQLAKNLFLTTEKKFERKLREVIYAFYIEYKMPKEKILTTYFNEVFWGSLNGIYIKGVKAASLVYFDKTPEDLTDFEAAILIGLLKGPYFYSPLNHLDRLKDRASVVYNRLLGLSLVSENKSILWDDNKWESWQKELENKNKNSFLYSTYQVSKSVDSFLEPFEKFVFYESVQKTRSDLSQITKGFDIGVKFIAIDSSCIDKSCPKIFTYYSKNERDLLTAIYEEKHQVGSVLKPIIYEQFIELGKKLTDEVSTKPITLKLKSGNWTPKDASVVHDDFVPLSYAIKKSKNIPLIRTASEIGFEKVEPLLLNYFPDLLLPLSEYPAQLLGAIELSLGNLAFTYLKYFKKTCENIENQKYTFEESILYEMSKASETTVSRVSTDLIKEILLFGKTGTTNQGLDNWYIAFDGKVFYAVWFGVDADRKNKKLRLAGATSAYRIFQNFQLYRGKQITELYCH